MSKKKTAAKTNLRALSEGKIITHFTIGTGEFYRTIIRIRYEGFENVHLERLVFRKLKLTSLEEHGKNLTVDVALVLYAQLVTESIFNMYRRAKVLKEELVRL